MNSQAARDQRDRFTTWLLLLVLTLVLWLGLKLDAGADATAPRHTGRAVADAGVELMDPATARATSESLPDISDRVGISSGVESGSRGAAYLEPEELAGFGEEELLPALFDALSDVDCDLDDPYSTCQ